MADTTTTEPAPTGGLDAYIAAATALLAIPLDPAWAGSVGANLAVLARAADLVAGFPLDDEAETAPIFAA